MGAELGGIQPEFGYVSLDGIADRLSAKASAELAALADGTEDQPLGDPGSRKPFHQRDDWTPRTRRVEERIALGGV